MLKRPYVDTTIGSPGNPSNIRLESVRPIWLNVSETDKFLLLEDQETGDVLMPLIYMKEILEANYSRKLASLKYRQVRVPRKGTLSQQEGLVYWQWAFESPHNVKLVVRKELGDANTPQGHLRLVLLPIVYNALVDRHRDVPQKGKLLFQALHYAMRQSNYWPLVRMPSLDVMERLDSLEATRRRGAAGNDDPADRLFTGPYSVDATALKYMFMFRDQTELEQSKKVKNSSDAVAAANTAAAAAGQHLQTFLGTNGNTFSQGNLCQQDSGTITSSHPQYQGALNDSYGVVDVNASGGGTMSAEIMAALLQKRGLPSVPSNPLQPARVDPSVNQIVKVTVDNMMKDVVDEISVLKASIVQMYSAAHRFALFAGTQQQQDGVVNAKALAKSAVTDAAGNVEQAEAAAGQVNKL